MCLSPPLWRGINERVDKFNGAYRKTVGPFYWLGDKT